MIYLDDGEVFHASLERWIELRKNGARIGVRPSGGRDDAHVQAPMLRSQCKRLRRELKAFRVALEASQKQLDEQACKVLPDNLWEMYGDA